MPEELQGAQKRRHGRELQDALLDAAWDELIHVGYARLTMGSIAARAGTSEPVLYRRWANKDRLVLAAMEHHRARNPVAEPDTGSLRGDLLAVLESSAVALTSFYAIAVSTSMSGLLADTGLTPAQIREQVMGGPSPAGTRSVYRRAQVRGEINLERVPPIVLDMPFDLLRHDLLLDLDPPSIERITSIVDDLFLPLIAARTATSQAHGPHQRLAGKT